MPAQAVLKFCLSTVRSVARAGNPLNLKGNSPSPKQTVRPTENNSAAKTNQSSNPATRRMPNRAHSRKATAIAASANDAAALAAADCPFHSLGSGTVALVLDMVSQGPPRDLSPVSRWRNRGCAKMKAARIACPSNQRESGSLKVVLRVVKLVQKLPVAAGKVEARNKRKFGVGDSLTSAMPLDFHHALLQSAEFQPRIPS